MGNRDERFPERRLFGGVGGTPAFRVYVAFACEKRLALGIGKADFNFNCART